MVGAIPIIDLSHSENYFPHKLRSNFVKRLVPFFSKSEDEKCPFSLNVKL